MPAAHMTVTSPRTGTTFAAAVTVENSQQATFRMAITVTIKGRKPIYVLARCSASHVAIVEMTVQTADGRGLIDEMEVQSTEVREVVAAGVGYMWAKMESAVLAENAAGRAAFRAALDAE